jgi:hypothetical protein
LYTLGLVCEIQHYNQKQLKRGYTGWHDKVPSIVLASSLIITSDRPIRERVSRKWEPVSSAYPKIGVHAGLVLSVERECRFHIAHHANSINQIWLVELA